MVPLGAVVAWGSLVLLSEALRAEQAQRSAVLTAFAVGGAVVGATMLGRSQVAAQRQRDRTQEQRKGGGGSAFIIAGLALLIRFLSPPLQSMIAGFLFAGLHGVLVVYVPWITRKIREAEHEAQLGGQP